MDESIFAGDLRSMQPQYQAGGRRATAMLASCSELHARAIHSGSFSFRRWVSLVPTWSRMPCIK
eukprot:365952-Chlamydomonas_euryale.AAC.8